MSDYVISYCGGQYPTQAWGNLADGRAFYFRARHGEWELETTLNPMSPRDEGWLWETDLVAFGRDYSNGWMERSAVLRILDAYLGVRYRGGQ